LTIEHGKSWLSLPGSVDNLTTDNLTRFFASQGITEEEAEDAYEYAYQWLTTAATSQPSQAGEIQPLLDQVNLAICKVGGRTPHDHSEQWWHPWFLWADQLLARLLPVAQAVAITEQFGSGPFANTVG
jgi:hypothetical protein